MHPLVEFEPTEHRYTLKTTKSRVRSVTDALSVITNFDRVPPDVLERARLFGHHVHYAIHLFVIGDLHEESLDEALRSRLFGFKKFLHHTKFEPTHSEEIVLDSSYRYCGMLDLRGRWLRRGFASSALIDLKSGAVPKTVGPQTAGYQQAVEGDKPRLRFALQLKEYDYRLIPLTDEADYSHFVSCLNVFKLSLKDNPYEETRV